MPRTIGQSFGLIVMSTVPWMLAMFGMNLVGRDIFVRLYLQNCLAPGSFGYNPLLIWMLVPDYTGTSNSKSVELASQFISSLAVFSITASELFSSLMSRPLL